MKHVTVIIQSGNGGHTYMEVPSKEASQWGDCAFEIPESTVRMWDAVNAAQNVVERQLRQLCNERDATSGSK